jgi:23S rRNA (guanosine2251-2'-O)-methyltransferase
MSACANIVFGVNAVLEKLNASPGEIEEILVAESAEGTALRKVTDIARQRGLPVRAVPARNLDRLASGYRHQGVVARVETYRYQSFADLLLRVAPESAPSPILVLDGLTDPRNLGALLRTAEAVGVEHVVIPKDRSAQVTPLVVKASAGAAHYLKISQVTNLRRAIGALKDNGYWAVGLDGQSPECIYDKDFPNRLVIVLGGEGKGLRPVIQRECDFLVSIPMLGKIASLNVAVAGAVFLYELVRQSRNIDKQNAKG